MSASLVVFFLSICVSLSTQVLMVELPNKLVFYDEYEQKIETPTFASFTPFKVIERNTTLSDKLTNCMSVEFNEARYFILKNEKKELVNYKEAGVVQLFKHQVIEIVNVKLATEVNYFSNIYVNKVSGKIPTGNYTSYLKRNNFHLVKYAAHKFVWVKSNHIETKRSSTTKRTKKNDIAVTLSDLVSKSNKLYQKLQSIYSNSVSPIWEKKSNFYQLISNDISLKEKLFNEFIQHIEKRGLSEYVEFDENLFSVRTL